MLVLIITLIALIALLIGFFLGARWGTRQTDLEWIDTIQSALSHDQAVTIVRQVPRAPATPNKNEEQDADQKREQSKVP